MIPTPDHRLLTDVRFLASTDIMVPPSRLLSVGTKLDKEWRGALAVTPLSPPNEIAFHPSFNPFLPTRTPHEGGQGLLLTLYCSQTQTTNMARHPFPIVGIYRNVQPMLMGAF